MGDVIENNNNCMIKNVKSSKITLKSSMKIYYDYLNMLNKGMVHSVLCHSKAGYGKTHTTINVLKELKSKYTYNCGVTTAVALYILLYENRDKILILDDIETIFKDEKIINLLKSALWEVDDIRVVKYKTTSKVLDNYPDSFEYTGKIIILANEIKGRGDESYKALMSRCLKHELIYSFNDLIILSQEIINDDDTLNEIQKNKINKIILNRIKPEHNFNFRILNRLKQFVKYDYYKAEHLFINSLDIDKDVQILIKIIKQSKNVKQQIIQYHELTGNSRMTYYRHKKQLKINGYLTNII